MILGTAQLGLEYGIHNTTGKPDRKSAFQILNYAWEHGVSTLDTAGAYGDSETIIGSYQADFGHSFRICTKTVSETAEELERGLEESLTRLRCDSIWVYYLHRFDACKNDALKRKMESVKERGKISNIGISIYEPEELEYIVENLPEFVDVVQIPYNLLDHTRWLQRNLLKRAMEKGIKIFARSIFLQGLFFNHPGSETAKQLLATDTLTELWKIAADCEMSMQQMAVSFVLGQPYIDEFLLGCETVGQLEQNLLLTCQAHREKLSEAVRRRMEELSAKTAENVIDPRRWNRRA